MFEIPSDSEMLIRLIREGDERFLHHLYERYREAFVRWAMAYFKCRMDEAGEIFQKSFTIFFLNIRDRKLESFSSKPETYLYGIGRRVYLETFRNKGRKVDLEQIPEPQQLDTSYLEQSEREHQQHLVARLLSKLGETCQKVLRLYYFRRFTMESIANELGYKNEKVAKKKKYECVKKMREMVQG